MENIDLQTLKLMYSICFFLIIRWFPKRRERTESWEREVRFSCPEGVAVRVRVGEAGTRVFLGQPEWETWVPYRLCPLNFLYGKCRVGTRLLIGVGSVFS